MLNYRDDFLRVRDDIVKRFEEYSEKTHDALAECVSDSLIYNDDIYVIIIALMPTSAVIHGDSLAERACDLMYEYMLKKGYVECIDD